jgi:hypothetical protein
MTVTTPALMSEVRSGLLLKESAACSRVDGHSLLSLIDRIQDVMDDSDDFAFSVLQDDVTSIYGLLLPHPTATGFFYLSG